MNIILILYFLGGLYYYHETRNQTVGLYSFFACLKIIVIFPYYIIKEFIKSLDEFDKDLENRF